MPKIEPGSRTRSGKNLTTDIGALRELVIICTTVEKPDTDVSTIVKRPGVIQVHARVRPVRGEMYLDYAAVWPGVRRLSPPTHEITIRTPPDVKIDQNHWVFHQDRYSATWYRVRTVEDVGGLRRFTILLCSPETTWDVRSDPATQELPPVFEVPDPIPDHI